VAAGIGFDEQECEEIAIAVSELASNQIKYAQGGRVIIEPLPGDPPGIRIEATDTGPGIPDVEKALADGFSTGGGLGLGLGAVNRLMEVVEIHSLPGQGTRIVCQRWLRPDLRQTIFPSPLEIGVATRPYLGMEINGDAFVVKQWGEGTLVGVIDGLGHGQLAHQAAETARQYVETHAEQPLGDLFRGTGRACLATRGVVMALAQFKFGSTNPGANRVGRDRISTNETFPIKFSFASLGNIEARLLGSLEPTDFHIRRGVIGGNAPNAIVTEHNWYQNSVLILHSDGLTTQWKTEDFPSITQAAPSVIAKELLSALGKDNDDATVLVVKGLQKDWFL
jgi:anti-sigma regulatory factor (Ser/Thr protein kinase)/serine/threonine protein phosphatase PrpC